MIETLLRDHFPEVDQFGKVTCECWVHPEPKFKSREEWVAHVAALIQGAVLA